MIAARQAGGPIQVSGTSGSSGASRRAQSILHSRVEGWICCHGQPADRASAPAFLGLSPHHAVSGRAHGRLTQLQVHAAAVIHAQGMMRRGGRRYFSAISRMWWSRACRGPAQTTTQRVLLRRLRQNGQGAAQMISCFQRTILFDRRRCVRSQRETGAGSFEI